MRNQQAMWEQIWNECRWIGGRCRRRFRCALAFSLAFKALNLIVLAPLAAAILRFCLTRWGRASVGNFELVSFFFSPVGLAALLGVGTVLLASLYLELSGLTRIVADDRLHWWQAFKSSTRLFHRLVHLGLLQLAMYLALAVPFLIGIGLAYWWFWSGKDLNGLTILKPPEFWWGAACAAALAAVYGLVALGLFLRHVYAIPFLTLEPGATVPAALRISAERSRGTWRRSASALAAWAAMQSLFATAVLGCLHLVWQFLLSRSGSSIALVALVTGTMLVIELVAAIILSVLANVSLAGVVLSLYRQVSPAGAIPASSPRSATTTQPRAATLGWKVAGALLAGASIVVVASGFSVRGLKLEDNLEITAHRAGATAAPENTVAALKQAIAEWGRLGGDRRAVDGGPSARRHARY
jgi:glycerophosphoryl diester phosphodiesterase